jgi:oxygen-independent coproporphyrinogen-3 oxidase
MWTYLPELAAETAPRYTSYPTAVEFSPEVASEQQRSALQALPADGTLGLYLHIPYCEQLCWYCGCNTGRSGNDDRVERYAGGLFDEIDTVSGLARGRVTAIHFGGGSPNALSAATLERLMARLRDRFEIAPDAEIALELDPRTLRPEFIATMARVGVTRVSLGVQTFAGHVQRRIGRIQPYEMVASQVAALRAAGIARINFDLMYGLPRQMAADITETSDLALKLSPDRVAMFGYAHLPQQLPRQRVIREPELPGQAERFAQARLAHDRFTAAGYVAVGFDHFARADDPLALKAVSGQLRRNFQGFTADAADALIGLGASAISDLPGLIVQNEKNAGRYRMRVSAGRLAGERGVLRSAEDLLRGAVIERLLCEGACDVADVCRAHGADESHLDAEIAALDSLVVAGICWVSGRKVHLRAEGAPYARLVARAFDGYRAALASRFSRAV